MFVDPCILVWLTRNTNKMQPVTEFIILKLLKAQHVSNGVPLIIRSSKLYLQPLMYILMWWPAVVQAGFPPKLDNGRLPHGYINQRLQIQFRAPDVERYAARKTRWAFNKFWNNKFYYKVASCWSFLLIHTRLHGPMNINPLNAKLNSICHLLALLGAHPILHISRIRVKVVRSNFRVKERESQRTQNKPCHSATLPTTSPTRSALGLNQSLRGDNLISSSHSMQFCN